MGDLIAIIIIVLILGGAIAYIVKAKKSGVHCIGCPTGSSCSGHCSSSESCNCTDDNNCNCGH